MKIRPYDSQISAQGQIQGERATPDSFGGQVADANENLADVGYKTADVMTQLFEAKDQVWRNNAVSNFQLQQFQNLQAAKTDPDFSKKYGADGATFASNFSDQLDTSMNELAGTAPSNRSAQQLQIQLNQVKEALMGHAIAFQAQTGGAFMKDQLTQSMESDAKYVAQSPQDTSMVLDRGKLAIANAPLLDPEQKTELLRSYEQNIALSAGKGLVLHSPEKVLAAIAPDVLASFKPTARVAANTSVPVTAFGTAVTNPAVEKYSSVTTQMAAQYSVDPNFLKAQQMAESRGNPAAVGPSNTATGQASLGIAQFQPSTAAHYGIDPMVPEQAIKGQAAMMSELLTQFGGDYRKAAAAYNWGPGNVTAAIAKYGVDWLQHTPPETQTYLTNIFSHAQPVATASTSLQTTTEQQAAAEPSRAGTNPDWFNKLNWQQQFDIVHEAEQGVRANQVRDSQTLALQKQQREAQQQQIMNGMFNRIGADKDPLTVAEVRHSDLDYQGKEHMLEAINKVTRGENATDPAVFNDLFQRIHAPDGTPNKITDDRALLPYAAGKGLSIPDLNVLRNELKGRNTPDGAAVADLKKNFFAMAKGQIDTSTFISNDPIGKQKFYEFQQKAISTIDQETRAGASALDLFDPKSKKYLGNLIPMYQRSGAQQMQDYSNFLANSGGSAKPVTPRAPGETPADYLKRTGSVK